MAEPRWWEVGEEPDYRFSLANERTFLAWVRTALGMLAGALAVTQLATAVPEALRLVIALSLALLAAAVSTANFWQWRDRQRRMRLGQPLGRTRVLPAVTIAMVVFSLLIVSVIVVSSR
jgi:putative membrane protein